MLIGKFEHGVEKGSFSFNFTFFVETDEKARQAPCIAGQINEFYLSQQNLVTVFGEKNDRFMLIVASQLEDIESYRALVDFHLTNPAIFDMKCLELCSKLKEIPECLIRAFLFENDRLATIDSLPEEDPFLCYLNHGKYEFNDFILAETSTPCPKEVRCPLESAACETAQLLRVITTYPPPNGFVINVIKIREEIHCYSINCRSEKKKIVTIKPKYPVNAFNMFAKSGRESVKREFSQFPITNNQLNQIMGQRWKEMSTEQKLPFLQLAEADKIRYKEEMKHAQGKKPLSDYNYFVQQEKQFISSTLPKNTSTAIGKHAGDRWSTIHSEEKRLYEILRSVDEEAYEKQFMR